jgi:hypothetical protein
MARPHLRWAVFHDGGNKSRIAERHTPQCPRKNHPGFASAVAGADIWGLGASGEGWKYAQRLASPELNGPGRP